MSSATIEGATVKVASGKARDEVGVLLRKGKRAASRSGVKKKEKIYNEVERTDSKHSFEIEQAEVGYGSAPKSRFSSAMTNFFS